jgi:raffinose/stachyose/melibiose transport system permease protein
MSAGYYAFFTLPTLIAFLIAFFIPFLLGIYLSFTKFTTVTNAHLIGFGNYVRAFTENNDFLNATLFTAKFTVVSLVLINLFAFSLALLLTRKIWGRNIFRTTTVYSSSSMLTLLIAPIMAFGVWYSSRIGRWLAI